MTNIFKPYVLSKGKPVREREREREREIEREREKEREKKRNHFYQRSSRRFLEKGEKSEKNIQREKDVIINEREREIERER